MFNQNECSQVDTWLHAEPNHWNALKIKDFSPIVRKVAACALCWPKQIVLYATRLYYSLNAGLNQKDVLCTRCVLHCTCKATQRWPNIVCWKSVLCIRATCIHECGHYRCTQAERWTHSLPLSLSLYSPVAALAAPFPRHFPQLTMWFRILYRAVVTATAMTMIWKSNTHADHAYTRARIENTHIHTQTHNTESIN